MAAPLSLSRAKLTRSDAPGEPAWTPVSVLVRGGELTVRAGRELRARRTVSTVTAVDRKTWNLLLDDGAVWTVERMKNCGCGG